METWLLTRSTSASKATGEDLNADMHLILDCLYTVLYRAKSKIHVNRGEGIKSGNFNRTVLLGTF